MIPSTKKTNCQRRRESRAGVGYKAKVQLRGRVFASHKRLWVPSTKERLARETHTVTLDECPPANTHYHQVETQNLERKAVFTAGLREVSGAPTDWKEQKAQV